jgi:hypothetical protein
MTPFPPILFLEDQLGTDKYHLPPFLTYVHPNPDDLVKANEYRNQDGDFLISIRLGVGGLLSRDFAYQPEEYEEGETWVLRNLNLYVDGQLIPHEKMNIHNLLNTMYVYDENDNLLHTIPASYLIDWKTNLKPGIHNALVRVVDYKTCRSVEYEWKFRMMRVP